jgi:hypothetical protein
LIKSGDAKAALTFLGGAASNRDLPAAQRGAAVKALRDLGADAKTVAKDLAIALEDDALRADAAEALVAIGAPAAPTIAVRLNAWLKDNQFPKGRLECIKTLERIGHASPETLKALTAALQRDTVEENRQAALQAGRKLTGLQ